MPHKDSEVTKQYMKQYRQEHKEEIQAQQNKKIECSCGGKYTQKHKARHNRTRIHQNWVRNSANLRETPTEYFGGNV